MEDLAISPWENSSVPTETLLLEFTPKKTSKIPKPTPPKDRLILTESNE